MLPTNENSEPTAAQPAKHEVQVDYEPPSEDAVGLADSPVRRLVGRPRSQEMRSRRRRSTITSFRCRTRCAS